MTTEQEIDTQVHNLRSERRRSALWWLVLAMVIACLTAGLTWAALRINDLQGTDSANTDRLGSLETALNKQRQQFNRCKDVPASTPGCEAPVAPPASAIPGPSGTPGGPGSPGVNGLQGPPGPRGPAGANGRNGEHGAPGATGANGAPGANGTDGGPGPKGNDGSNGSPGADGSNGTNGADGSAGPKGDPGPVGPQGDPGANGTNGTNGTNGVDAPAIVSIIFGNDPAACVLIVNFSNGTSTSAPAPAIFCTP